MSVTLLLVPHACECRSVQDGAELPLKEAGPGDSVHSLLSIMDAILGRPSSFKSVAARAVRDTYVQVCNIFCPLYNFILFVCQSPNAFTSSLKRIQTHSCVLFRSVT